MIYQCNNNCNIEITKKKNIHNSEHEYCMNLGHIGCGVGGSKIQKIEYALYCKILCLKSES